MITTIGYLVVCIIVADLITGLGHWIEDTYCADDMKWFVVHAVCDPNIDHHLHPAEFGTFIRRNRAGFFLGAIGTLATYLLGIMCWQTVFTVWLASMANEYHSWQHGRVRNGFVEFMFDTQLIQSKQNHNKHHIPPYMDRYCILLSLNNAWMDRISFWRKVEWVVSLTGIKSKRENRRDYEEPN